MTELLSIGPERVTSALSALFSRSMPTATRCQAVLAGGCAGLILTDDPHRPSVGYVQEAADGTLYCGGRQDATMLARVVEVLRQDGIVWLAFREGDLVAALAPANPNVGAECLEFDRPAGVRDLAPLLDPRHMPAGFRVARMYQALAERSPERDETITRYGSIANFLAHGFGFAVLDGDRIACEVFADAAVDGVRELGVRTQREYRRRGLAMITCAHAIAACAAEGSATTWDCAKLNLASVNLARRLGFGNERGYRLLGWFPPPRQPV